MAIVFNPKALLPRCTASSDSDSLKSNVVLEYDSIDSCTSANEDSKKNRPCLVAESSNLILSSDDVHNNSVEAENVAPFDEDYEREFKRAIQMQNNYLE